MLFLGRGLHTAVRVTCKRERESERDTEGEDTLSTYHKLQRQMEITTVHGTAGKQPGMVNEHITSVNKNLERAIFHSHKEPHSYRHVCTNNFFLPFVFQKI